MRHKFPFVRNQFRLLSWIHLSWTTGRRQETTTNKLFVGDLVGQIKLRFKTGELSFRSRNSCRINHSFTRSAADYSCPNCSLLLVDSFSVTDWVIDRVTKLQKKRYWKLILHTRFGVATIFRVIKQQSMNRREERILSILNYDNKKWNSLYSNIQQTKIVCENLFFSLDIWDVNSIMRSR